MNENKTTTYGDLKIRKQELRDEGILGDNMEEYLQNMNAIKDAEALLLWGIIWTDIEPEQVKHKAYKRVKYAVIAISIAVLLAILFFSGCNTIDGIGRDLSAVSSPYIQEK